MTLERSESYVELDSRDETREFRYCTGSPRGGYVSCQGFAESEGHLALWDARSGHRVLDRRDRCGWVSPDETRAWCCDGPEGAVEYTAQELPSGRVVGAFTAPGKGVGDPRFSPDGSLLALGGIGVVDSATARLLWKHEHDFPQDCWLPQDRIVALRAPRVDWRFARAPRAVRLDIREGRTGALVASLDDDADVLGLDAGGARMLTVDPAGVYRVRDARTFAEVGRVGPIRHAALSRDGRFLYAQSSDALRVRRLSDGAEYCSCSPCMKESAASCTPRAASSTAAPRRSAG